MNALHQLRMAALDAALCVDTPVPAQLEHMADAVDALLQEEPPSPFWARHMTDLAAHLRLLADRMEVV